MANLPIVTRVKAIEIPNALPEEGYAEGVVIRIAIAQAKHGGTCATSAPAPGAFPVRTGQRARLCGAGSLGG